MGKAGQGRMHWTFLLSAISATVLGQALLKAGAGSETFTGQLLDWRTIAGLGIYGLASILYIVALRRIPLSVALPCTALSYIVVALIGHYAFNEPLGLQRLGALGLIGAGVLVLAVS
jgi:small multidrug resistance pump